MTDVSRHQASTVLLPPILQLETINQTEIGRIRCGDERPIEDCCIKIELALKRVLGQARIDFTQSQHQRGRNRLWIVFVYLTQKTANVRLPMFCQLACTCRDHNKLDERSWC